MDTIEQVNLTRRQFLVSSAGGLAIGFILPSTLGSNEALAATPVTTTTVNTWLQIGTDETITLTIGASEMGQGSFSGLAQILAEDLMVDYLRIKTVQGKPSLASPAPIGAAINTVGSSVTRNNYWRLRDAGAIAREMLLSAAMAQAGDTNRASFLIDDGAILHQPSKIEYTYGQLAAAAAKLAPPASAPLVASAQFQSIGKTLPRVDIPLKVDGSAIYGIDVRLPNMVYAVVRHSPSFGGTLVSVPAKPSGMIAVVPLSVAASTDRGTEAPGNVNAVAVVGSNTWDTWQAARRLTLKWNLPPNTAALNSTQFVADAQALMKTAVPFVAGGTNGPGTVFTVETSPTDARVAVANASRKVNATYSLPYVAHACMEVLNCTVDFVPGVKCDVYAPTQSARTALQLVMKLTGMTAAQVTINTTFLGGGLGRKAEVDFISQAVQIAMVVQRPVKLTWPREEDFTRDQYRPMALVNASAGLDAAGNIVGWTYRNVSPSILSQRGAVLGPKGDSQGYEASAELPYNFGSHLVEWVSHTSPIPVGFWRSVGASINTFAVESMIDELALAAGQDGYTFRRARLTDPRWIAVLDAAAKLGGWDTPVPRGRARGIAIGKAFNSIVAEVVEISSVTSTSIKVEKVAVAIDCYLSVNPGSVEAQITGGVVHGLNAALFGKQTFVNGAAQARNFNRSRMILLREMPQVSVTILPSPANADRTVPIGGVGELGVPTLAPALANAHAKLTGSRVRTLPFFPNATMDD